MNFVRRVARQLMMVVALAMSACGGGGGAGGDSSTSPVALAQAPAIAIEPASTVSSLGQPATFTVQATGTGSLSYQWKRGGVPLQGETASTLTLPSVGFGDDNTTYSVVVQNAAGTVTSKAAVLTVKPTGQVASVSGCQEIAAPGAYQLQADISGGGIQSPCLRIHDTHSVALDCQQHTISDEPTQLYQAISVENVQDFLIKNCHIQTVTLLINRSTNGSLSSNTFSAMASNPAVVINVDRSQRMTFDNNVVTSGTYQQHYGRGNVISNNHISAPAGVSSVAGVVLVSWGDSNRIHDNQLDGRWDGILQSRNGADDGVIIADESNVEAYDNAIANTWDCGVEYLGTVTSSVVRRNSIRNAEYGVCGAYWLSMSRASIVQNSVEHARYVLYFFRAGGLRPAGTDFDGLLPADSSVLFEDVDFDGNTFSNPYESPAGGVSYAGDISVSNWYEDTAVLAGAYPGEHAASRSEYHVGNIRFANNDFGHIDNAITLGSPPFAAGLVVDGGGNVCGAALSTPYPLACH